MTDVADSLRPATVPRRSIVSPPAESAGWVMIAGVTIATAGLTMARGLAFDWMSAMRPLVACGGLLVGTAIYRTVRPDERIATCLSVVAQLLAAAAVAETLSYAVATFDRPLWDATLASWDKAIGLDWRAYLDFVAARPWLAAVYGFAYRSFIVQLIAAAAILGLAGRRAECRAFALAFTMTATITVAVSALMPANSEFVYRGLPFAGFPTLDVTAAYAPLSPFEHLRTGGLRVISLTDSQGIISFPSLHAALGVVFILVFWPLRWLRWPALALNLLLVAATPINGGHYFVDVIAGTLIAIVAMVLARRLDARFGTAAVSERPRDQARADKKSR